MRRRDFISLIGGATAAWPLPAQAQQTRLPIIGFVGADATSWSPWTIAFVQRLHELGWTEGRTVAIEYRWNEGKPERIAEIAAEFIRLRVDVIVTNAIATPALKQATTVIPIVFAIAPDPVRGGFQSRRERCREPTPVTPQYAAFPTYKAARCPLLTQSGSRAPDFAVTQHGAMLW